MLDRAGPMRPATPARPHRPQLLRCWAIPVPLTARPTPD